MDVVILAAGQGSRMGGRKARLLLDGAPLALAHARRARALGAGRVLVVAGRDDLAWIARECDAVESAAPDAAGSLAVGVRALCMRIGARSPVLVVPVDSLPVHPAVVDRLRAALDAGALAAVPTHDGRGGHPVLVRTSVLAPYLEPGRVAPPLRDVLRALGPGRAEVSVDQRSVVTDLDTPDDVLHVTGEPPRFFEASETR